MVSPIMVDHDILMRTQRFWHAKGHCYYSIRMSGEGHAHRISGRIEKFKSIPKLLKEGAVDIFN